MEFLITPFVLLLLSNIWWVRNKCLNLNIHSTKYHKHILSFQFLLQDVFRHVFRHVFLSSVQESSKSLKLVDSAAMTTVFIPAKTGLAYLVFLYSSALYILFSPFCVCGVGQPAFVLVCLHVGVRPSS